MGGSLAAADLEARRKELLDRLARARDSREEIDARIAAAQAELKTALLLRWPELMHPYSSGYHAVIDTHWADIERQIRADDRYLALLAAETERAATRSEERDLRRHLTQIDKIYRLKQLARLDTAMHVHGSQRARDEYAALVACESGYLETAGAVPPTSANTRSRSAQDTGFMR